MPENRPVRLIRRRPQTKIEGATDVPVSTRPEASERQIKIVISGWVRDHRQRSEEFRRTLASMLSAGELPASTR
jgi:hypothetical protein